MNPGRNQKKIQTVSGIVLLVVVIMLIGIYFLWITARDDMDAKSPVIVIFSPRDTEEQAEPAKAEKNVYSEHGFRLEYGEGWTLETARSGDGDNEIFTVTLDNDDERVIITSMPSEMEEQVRQSFSIDNEESVEISNITAQRLEGTSLKDGSSETLILLTQNGSLYSIRGSGVGFDTIVEDFKLL